MKKILSMVVAFSLIVSVLLTGCGKAPAKSGNEPTSGASETATALEYPTGPVTLIVPFGAGGGTDLLGRIFAKYAQEKLGKSVVVVNVGGAGGSIGSRQVLDAKPDGHTIMLAHNNILLNEISGITDYTHNGFTVGPKLVDDAASGLYVSSKAPYKNMTEFVEYCKAHPGEVRAATEMGSFTYFMLLKLQDTCGIKLNIVDVGGNADKVTALLGGHIEAIPNQHGTVKSYVESGDFVSLGFHSEKRSTIFPDVPTCKEQGIDFIYPGYAFSLYFPKGTPQEIIAVYDDIVKEMNGDASVAEELKRIGVAMDYLNSKENAKAYDEMYSMYKELAVSVGLVK